MKHLITSFLTALMVWGASAQSDCVPRKNNNRLVYDGAGALTPDEAELLDAKLQDFAAATSNQIVVALVEDLCGFTPEQMATEIGDSWGVGQNKEDNGIVVLVKPFGNKGDRHAFIAVGKGLEGAIPDATAYQIVQNEMLPNFKQEAIYAGLDAATTVLMELARGEYNSDAYAARNARKVPWQAGLIVMVIFLIVIVAWLAKAKKYAATNDIGFWTAMMLLNQAGRSHRGSWGHFSGGSGGFGGGGGGFGGFGGGSFGGGGAGGSW